MNNAFQPQPPTKLRKGGHQHPPRDVTVRGGSRLDGVRQTTSNGLMIPTSVGETLAMLGVIAMNYVFRFNPTIRDSSSLADYNKTYVSFTDVIPTRPYYDYSLSHDDNQNETRGTFGITFGMPEYAFFVPAFVLPLLVIIAVEVGKHLYPTKQMKEVTAMGVTFQPVMRRILRFYYVFLLFGSMAGMFTSFIKLLVPVARPHFLEVCQLDVNREFRNQVARLCHNPVQDEVWEALRSFPSYHATIAVYCGAFLCLYIYHLLTFRGLYSVNILLTLPVVVMTTIATFHRLVTFHNSFMDIVWGGVIGLFMALYAVYGMLNRFQERIWTIKPHIAAPPSGGDHTPAREMANGGHEMTTAFMATQQRQQQQAPQGYNMRHQHDGYGRPTAMSKDQYLQPNPYDGNTPTYGSPQAPLNEAPLPTSSLLPRVDPANLTVGPVGRPTQAFNASFVMDDEYNRPKTGQPATQDYNTPRQRYSVPPALHNSPPAPRSASVFPAVREQRPRSRYEGASYF